MNKKQTASFKRESLKREMKTKIKKLKLTERQLIPYRCPICGGNGLVSGGFYASLAGCSGTTANVTEKCRSCDNGIIWG